MYENLGIPKHKSNLFMYRNYYSLDKSYHNFIIIFDYDTKIRLYTSEFRYGRKTRQTYVKHVKEHLDKHYDLRYGNALKNLIRRALKER